MGTATELGVRPDNQYLGKTGTTPRPTTATHPGGDGSRLATAQAAWDMAKGWADGNERLRLERLARVDAAQEEKRAARRRRDDDIFIGDLKDRYLAADPLATDADFDRDLPEIRRQHRLAAALRGEADDRSARAANAARAGGIM